ncbi:MAG TPA: efflux RND transporter periplasmic adaptor subunit, partial [Thermodesulfovibrionales bacterium]|nr:efflux RND transporter periplasmic adaptor subunit [Thermodesulfovibrionales bacterium]
MKKQYLTVLVAVSLALLAAVYAAKNGSITKKDPAPAASGHQGHDTAKPQETMEMPQQQVLQEEAPAVEIPEDKQQMLGMKTVEVSVRPLRQVLRTVGSIEYDERRTATVNAKFEGWIEKLHADYTGRYVKKGEPLAEVYSPELVATQQELINAVTWARQSDSTGASGAMRE